MAPGLAAAALLEINSSVFLGFPGSRPESPGSQGGLDGTPLSESFFDLASSVADAVAVSGNETPTSIDSALARAAMSSGGPIQVLPMCFTRVLSHRLGWLLLLLSLAPSLPSSLPPSHSLSLSLALPLSFPPFLSLSLSLSLSLGAPPAAETPQMKACDRRFVFERLDLCGGVGRTGRRVCSRTRGNCGRPCRSVFLPVVVISLSHTHTQTHAHTHAHTHTHTYTYKYSYCCRPCRSRPIHNLINAEQDEHFRSPGARFTASLSKCSKV